MMMSFAARFNFGILCFENFFPQIISIEVNKIDTSVLRRILEKNGYSFYKELYLGPAVLDHVFVHESVTPIPPPNLVGKKH